jgi:hypothetical protein
LPDREGILRIVSLKYSKEPTDEKMLFLPGREVILRIVSPKNSNKAHGFKKKMLFFCL